VFRALVNGQGPRASFGKGLEIDCRGREGNAEGKTKGKAEARPRARSEGECQRVKGEAGQRAMAEGEA